MCPATGWAGDIAGGFSVHSVVNSSIVDTSTLFEIALWVHDAVEWQLKVGHPSTGNLLDKGLPVMVNVTQGVRRRSVVPMVKRLHGLSDRQKECAMWQGWRTNGS